MMLTYFLSFLAVLIACGASPPPAFAAVFHAENKGTGVTVDLQGESHDQLKAGQSVRVKIHLGEPGSHDSTPMHRPAAWISPRLSEQVAREVSCREKVKRFSSGRLADRAEIDLTAYLLVTLNQDKTIGFINPYIALNRTKLESLVVLPANGLDWAQSDDGAQLAVTMPDAHAVAVIDTESRTIVHLIDTGANTRPTRILRDRLGHRMWVGLDHDTRVLALDILTGTIEANVTVGEGVHSLAQSTDGTYVFVSNSDDGTVSIINAKAMQPMGQVVTGHTPLAMAWSAAVNLLYVAHVNEDVIVALDPSTQKIVSRIETPRGGIVLRFDPDGQTGILLRQRANSMSVLDASTQRVLASGPTLPLPEEVLFTHSYAYVRSAGSEKIRLYDLAGLRRGQFNAVEVQAGRDASEKAQTDPGVADMLATIPGGGGVIVANSADRQLYFYHEGMMATSGTFQTYSRSPLGLLVLDRGLKEISPGTYEARVRFPHGGRYDLAVSLGKPTQIECFQVQVEGPTSPTPSRKQMIRLDVLEIPAQLAPNQPLTVRMRLTDPTTDRAVPDIVDLQVLTTQLPGVWQRKVYAVSKGDGMYEAALTFPRPGRFTLTMGSASLDLPFAQSPVKTLHVSSKDREPEHPNAVREQ